MSLPEPDRSYQAAVGRRLREHRTYLGISISLAARAAGYSKPTLYGYETGLRNMTVEDLDRIARAYAVDVATFLPELSEVGSHGRPEGLGDVA